MGRREARLERQAEKHLRDAEKSARLRERPQEEKTIRIGADPGSIFHMRVAWTIERRDCVGAWSWGIPRQWSDDDWSRIIEPKLAEWGKLTWAEIDGFSAGPAQKRHKMHHSMAVDVIVDEAQYRLVEIDHDLTP